MITINLEEKNAKLILNLLRNRMDNIDDQIKQLENDKKELKELFDNLNPVIGSANNPIVADNPIVNNILQKEEPEFILREIEFDEESVPEITFGKNKLRRSEDKQSIYMRRNGYRAHVKAKLEDLIYLQEHPFEIENAISNISNNKRTVLTRILKEIDFSKLDLIFQSCPEEVLTKDQTKGQDETKDVIQEDDKQSKNQNDEK